MFSVYMESGQAITGRKFPIAEVRGQIAEVNATSDEGLNFCNLTSHL